MGSPSITTTATWREGDCFGTGSWLEAVLTHDRDTCTPKGALLALATEKGEVLEGNEETKLTAGERERSLLSRLSSSMGTMQKEAFGKGPIRTKSYMFDDMLLIVMREGLTQAEQTMLDFGRHDLVREFRQEFENEMTRRIIDMVQELTDRKVLTYQSQVMFDPHVVVEMFVFDSSMEAHFAAAEAGPDADA